MFPHGVGEPKETAYNVNCGERFVITHCSDAVRIRLFPNISDDTSEELDLHCSEYTFVFCHFQAMRASSHKKVTNEVKMNVEIVMTCS